jgi:hypothetical protein
MSYTLRVLFSGLCAFVPERSFSTGDPGAVTVLLPNALKPIQLKNKVKKEDENDDGVDILNSHFPLVSFDLADLHPQSSRKPDLRREDSGRGACLLLGEELSFAMRVSEFQNNALTVPQALEGQNSEDSLASMARLDDATPGLFVKRELLDLSKFKTLDLVIARTHLARGSLRVSKKSDKECTFSPPVDGQDSIPQKIATELALDLEGVEGNVSILTRGLGGERSITLSPVRRPDLLEIRIQNIELDDFLGIPGGLRNGDEVSDFEIYYQLMDGEVDPRFPLQPEPDEDDGGSVRNPSLCPPSELARAAA